MIHENTSPVATVSAIHFELTSSLTEFVQGKTERLFRHDPEIARIRIELDCEQKRPGYGWFAARGHLLGRGFEMNAVVCSDKCHQAVSLLVDKLDRMLRRRAGSQKEQRNHPRAIEFDALLPKAV